MWSYLFDDKSVLETDNGAIYILKDAHGHSTHKGNSNSKHGHDSIVNTHFTVSDTYK